MVRTEQSSNPADSNGESEAPDPAVVLSQAWMQAHVQTLALCLKQQRLETELETSVGFPGVAVAVSEGSESAVSSSKNPKDVLGRSTAAEFSPGEAAEGLVDQWTRWRSKDAELGYSAAKRAEQKAAKKEQRLLGKLAITPARTIAGVIAKLAVVLREGEDNCDPADFPQLHIRSVLNDLQWITGCDTTGEFKPSSATAAPLRQQRSNG